MSREASRPSGSPPESRRAFWRTGCVGLVSSAAIGLVLVTAWIAFAFWYESQGYGRWITRAEAGQQGSALSIPGDFPRVIPIYPGARLTRDRFKRELGRDRIELTFESQGAVESIYNYYRRFFNDNGFGTGRLWGSTRIHRAGELAVVVSGPKKRIRRHIRITIRRKKSETVTTIIIETLDIVQCGRGEPCYKYPGVAKY